MDLADLDRELDRLRRATERAGANLLELDQSSSRALLAAARLEGLSAERWAEAEEALAGLFQSYAALSGVVDAAAAARGIGLVRLGVTSSAGGAARAGTVRRAARAGRAHGRARLVSGSRVLHRCTPDELLASMAQPFALARSVIVTAAETWDAGGPAGAVGARPAGRRVRGRRSGGATDGRAALERRLDTLEHRLLADPLAFDAARRSRPSVRRSMVWSTTADGARRVRDDFEAELAAAQPGSPSSAGPPPTSSGRTRTPAPASSTCPRRRPSRSKRSMASCTGSPHSPPTVTGCPSRPSWRAGAGASTGTAHDVDQHRTELDDLLEHRRQLRGRLDAYTAKSAASGCVEDELLEELRRQAEGLLYDAPIDLVRAEAGLRRYQEALRHGARAAVGAGAMNCARSGCTGTIVDGYCDDCGMAPRPRVDERHGSARRPAGHGAVRAVPAHRGWPARAAATSSTRRHRLGRGLVECRRCRPGIRRPRSWPKRTSPSSGASAASATSRSAAVGTACPGGPRASAASAATRSRSSPSCAPGDLVGRAVRGGGLPRPRRSRLDLPGQGPQGGRPLGGAEGPAQHRRRATPCRGARRAALPGRGRAPEHREDPQLRRARRRRLHRHGVRQRRTACAACSRRDGRPTAAGPIRCPSTRRSPTCSRSCPRSGTCTTSASLFCDFKPDNVIRTAQSVKLIDLGGVYRMDDATSPIYGTPGYQAPEIARTGPTVPSDLFTVARTLDGAVHRLPGVPGHVPVHAPAGRRRPPLRRARLALPLPRAGDGRRSRRRGSRAPTRWPRSSRACCAR